MASKEYYLLLEQLKKRSSSLHPSLEEMRAHLEKFLAAFPPDPDIVFDAFSIGSIPACWALAPGVTKKKVVLFFHGGGFNAGSIKSHYGLMGKISRASGCALLAIGYRLAPEFPFPAALEDALQGYQWLLDHSYPSSHIFLAGSSAGAGLVLSLCLKLKEKNLPQPAAVVSICPMVDLTFSSDSITTNREKDWIGIDRLSLAVKDYCRDENPTNPLISPLFGDLYNLPPLFIQVGASEIFRDEALAIAKKAEEKGVSVTLEVWPEMVHCWQLFASKIPEGEQAIDHIGTFIKSCA
jgi:epsilon-lactone hydrolase